MSTLKLYGILSFVFSSLFIIQYGTSNSAILLRTAMVAVALTFA